MSTGTQDKAIAEAQFFNLDSPLLAQGRFDNKIARTDLLTMIVKVYASGGENALHMHPYEDHSFIVLQGDIPHRSRRQCQSADKIRGCDAPARRDVLVLEQRS